jgi:hypothetical protein
VVQPAEASTAFSAFAPDETDAWHDYCAAYRFHSISYTPFHLKMAINNFYNFITKNNLTSLATYAILSAKVIGITIITIVNNDIKKNNLTFLATYAILFAKVAKTTKNQEQKSGRARTGRSQKNKGAVVRVKTAEHNARGRR